MEDKKKKVKPEKLSDDKCKKPKSENRDLPDIDDLIFADEYIKLHSEK